MAGQALRFVVVVRSLMARLRPWQIPKEPIKLFWQIDGTFLQSLFVLEWFSTGVWLCTSSQNHGKAQPLLLIGRDF